MPNITENMLKKAALSILLLLQFTTLPTAQAWFENKWTKQLKGAHIQGVIEQWGQPRNAKKQLFSSDIHYSWKYCEKTGVVISQCNYGNCRSWPEYTCCFQGFVTDKHGIIKKYTENAGNKGYVCTNLNIQAIQKTKAPQQQAQTKKKDRFGSLYIIDPKTRNLAWAAGYTDKQEMLADLRSDCGGKCVESVPFKNMCAAVATPKGSTFYYYVADKDPKVAVAAALEDCEKGEGKNAGCEVLDFNINQVNRLYVCADLDKQK